MFGRNNKKHYSDKEEYKKDLQTILDRLQFMDDYWSNIVRNLNDKADQQAYENRRTGVYLPPVIGIPNVPGILKSEKSEDTSNK